MTLRWRQHRPNRKEQREIQSVTMLGEHSAVNRYYTRAGKTEMETAWVRMRTRSPSPQARGRADGVNTAGQSSATRRIVRAVSVFVGEKTKMLGNWNK